MAQSPQPHGGRPSPPTPPPAPAPRPGQQTPAAQAGDAAQDLKEQVQETAGQAAAQVKDTAQSLIGSQKGRATQSLHTLADTLHQTGDQLRESEGGAFFAPYVDRASEHVRRFSGHLDEREVSELVADLERYARTRPAAFLGGTFALGVLVTRFLRSSSQREGGDMGGYQGRPLPARAAMTPGTPPRPPALPPASGAEPRPDARPANPAAKQGATPGPGTTAAVGGTGARQTATPPANAEHRAEARQGAAPPPQPAPLLPPDLDPRPGQRDPRKPQP